MLPHLEPPIPAIGDTDAFDADCNTSRRVELAFRRAMGAELAEEGAVLAENL